ncbi:MAG: dihydroorotase [Phototrophicales bacterium]
MGRKIKIPPMLDPHVHLRGMDWSHKGDFYTETCAAAAGGYWAVFDMPNTPPATLDRTALDHKLQAINHQAVCDWGVYFCAGANQNWGQYPLVINDICGLKMFNNSTTGNLLVDDPTVREEHFKHWDGNKIFAQHAENETCREIINLVRKYRKPTHILHVCTKLEVDLIRQAKNDGLPITCGACPHHLWLTQADLTRLGSLGWMKPPLQTQQDQDALWQGIVDGVIDIIESDHAPHTLEEKSSTPPPYGVPGLETTLPLLLTAVHEGRLTLARVIEMVSINPCRIYGIVPPPETYTVVDLDTSEIITGDKLHTKVKWSPFEGMRVQGKVIETWVRGTQVYDGENILVKPGFGKNVYAHS